MSLKITNDSPQRKNSSLKLVWQESPGETLRKLEKELKLSWPQHY